LKIGFFFINITYILVIDARMWLHLTHYFNPILFAETSFQSQMHKSLDVNK